MSEKKKEISTVVVPYEIWTEYDYIDQGTFYIVNAMQERIYFKTSDRLTAQQKCNELYGENFYIVKAAKSLKTKSRLESGGYSVIASNSRKGFAPQLRKST